MTRPKTTPCRSCGAPLRFTKNQTTGKWLPIDPEPHENGNITIDQAGFSTVHGPEGVLAALEADPDVRLYLSHHSTCPDGKQWRTR